jgi:hypothetical protein
MRKSIIGRPPEEEEAITWLLLYIGAHWKEQFIPEDDLDQAVNELLRIPKCLLLIDLLKNKKLKLHVHDRATKDRTGCWLSISREG